MKRILIYLLTLFALSLGSCKKEPVDLTFDAQPEERISERMEELRSLLTGSEHGWKGNLRTGLGSYGFYLNFEDETNCLMLSDLNPETSSEPSSSTYRVIWAMNAALSFDTFNYITMLQEPSSDYGGVAPNGYKSDVDFDYIKNSGDTIYLTGKKYGLPFTLTKATAEDKNRYLDNGYADAIAKTLSFFTDQPNTYINVDSAGTTYQVGIALNYQVKMLIAGYLDTHGKSRSVADYFSFDLDGLDLYAEGLPVLGKRFIGMEWENDKLLVLDAEGEKFELHNSERPIIPLNKAIGAQFIGFDSPYMTYFPGTSPAGLDILSRFHEGLEGGIPGYSFNSGYIGFLWDAVNQRVNLLGFSSQNEGVSGWTTTIVYDYEFDENTENFTLTKRSGPTGGYTGPVLDQLDDFLQNSAIRLEYYIEEGVTYGLMKGVDRPEVEMTFRLQN